MYLYSFFGFNFFSSDFFNPNIIPNGENTCVNNWQCFITVLAYCPRSTGCIGDLMRKPSYNAENLSRYFLRYIFDFTLFFIINSIMIKVLLIFIIDNFIYEVRKNKSVYEKNIPNCLICETPKSYFDTTSANYNYHIKHTHNIWKYYYFYIFIKNCKHKWLNFDKDTFMKIINRDIYWFPYKNNFKED